ncbi:dTDP-glucose 4,6-dehydratase/UDP-glucose 4-epimerase [Ruegeria sp. P4]|nr:dTDP-glucose 4,6-dehydratase/UDP-glucose 4-epimerase [Ruegeria sp. P4]
MSNLVTGGAGFLGYHLAYELAEAGRSVVIVDNLVRSQIDPRFEALTQRDNVKFLHGDLCDQGFVNDLPDVTRVFHLAALNGTQNFYDKPLDVIHHSTIPALNLLDRYAQTNLELFAYTGSSESYAGAISRGLTSIPTPETTPLVIDEVNNPRWSYAAGKMHGELAVVAAGSQYNTPWQIWRVHNCVGPRMGAKHVIPDFVERAVRGVYELYGYEDTRTFIYSDDAIAAMIGLANAPAAIGQIINIGGEEEITMQALGAKIMSVLGHTGAIALHPSPTGSVKRRCPDIRKLKELLPTLNIRRFDDTLRSTVEAVVSEIEAGQYGTK